MSLRQTALRLKAGIPSGRSDESMHAAVSLVADLP